MSRLSITEMQSDLSVSVSAMLHPLYSITKIRTVQETPLQSVQEINALKLSHHTVNQYYQDTMKHKGKSMMHVS